MNIDVGWLLLAVVIVRVSVRWVRAVRRRWNADQINAQVKAGVIPHRKAYGRAFPGRSSRPGRVCPRCSTTRLGAFCANCGRRCR